ncbi:uncharacterized protein LOC119672398 [Teleopsis dalmanni]|uniref:uncharacterized protein LOC119672398 n=1 Tax=Teleopsis dalmanni TaxID=139649 RepID=UPI0018CFA313|nr:uncharacterized protein LOC119672398 [Teleopsis dalmanni]
MQFKDFIILLMLWVIESGVLGSSQEIVDCTNADIVTSIFNEPIELTLQDTTILRYENVTINEIQNTTNNEFEKKYIDARLEEDEERGFQNLIIFTTEDFPKYAEEQTAARITLKVTMACDMGRVRTLIFFQPFKEGNYFKPKFSQDVYDIILPTPIFAGFDLTSFVQIAAKDDDLANNQISFASSNATLYHITVGTKNGTSDDKKIFFAALTLNRIYLSLERELIFHITATDSGSPPLSSNATVVIRADRSNSLPPIPRFEQSLYSVLLHKNLTLQLLRISLLPETYSENVRFSLKGRDADIFEMQNNANVVQIKLARNVTKEEIKPRSFLHFSVQAAHLNLTDFGETAIYVRPVSFKETFHFEESSFRGNISSTGELTMEIIEFDDYGYSDEVMFELLGDSTVKDLFNYTQVGPNFYLTLSETVNMDAIINISFITLEMQARFENLKASVPLFISLPIENNKNLNKQPEFEKPYYEGRINELNEFLMEPIQLVLHSFEANKTTFSLSGNKSELFNFNVTNHTVDLRLLSVNNELLNTPMILLTLTAKNDEMNATTTIIIENLQVKNSTNNISTKLFRKTWISTKLELDEDEVQILQVEPIALQGNVRVSELGYSLEGVEATYFEVNINASRNFVFLNQLQQLPEDLLDSKSLLQLELKAFMTMNSQIMDKVLIFIELPKKDCTELPSGSDLAPIFSSEKYMFSVSSEQIGNIGQINAVIPESNITVNYFFNTENVYLRERLSINSNSGDIMLLSTLPSGTFNFTIKAVNTQSFREANATAHITVTATESEKQCFDIKNAVRDTLIIKHIEEEKPVFDVLNATVGNCTYQIEHMYPADKAYVYINITTGMISTISIDREDSIFANMTKAQVQVRLKLICSNNTSEIERTRKRRDVGVEFEEFSMIYMSDISYAPDTTWLVLEIVDINDNAPEFIYPNVPMHLGYPAVEISFELFPQYLTKIRAVDLDSGDNARIQYNMRPNSHFDIEADTGIIYPRSNALKSVESVELIVQAVDRSGSGLSTGAVLFVKRLSSNFVSLVSFESNKPQVMEDVLLSLEEKSGYKVNLIKFATIPSNGTTSNRMFSSRLGNATEEGTVIQKAWVYAFNGPNPIECEVFQNKILADKNITQLVNIETFEEIGLTANAAHMLKPVNLIEQESAYIATIITLSLICVAFICFFVWLYKPYNKCFKEGSVSEDVFCNESITPSFTGENSHAQYNNPPERELPVYSINEPPKDCSRVTYKETIYVNGEDNDKNKTP